LERPAKSYDEKCMIVIRATEYREAHVEAAGRSSAGKGQPRRPRGCSPETPDSWADSHPYSWRHLKRLHVARLERVGCGPYLIDPPLRENFEAVMDEALHRHGGAFLRAMLDRGSPLIDVGYLNPDALAAAATRIAAGTPALGDNSVCNVIALEAALSSFGHAESPTPVPA
jgi:hypothetical protein